MMLGRWDVDLWTGTCTHVMYRLPTFRLPAGLRLQLCVLEKAMLTATRREQRMIGAMITRFA